MDDSCKAATVNAWRQFASTREDFSCKVRPEWEDPLNATGGHFQAGGEEGLSFRGKVKPPPASGPAQV